MSDASLPETGASSRHGKAGEIVEAVLEMIAQAELAPGARLPSERSLAAQFGASRSIVREALMQLKSDGVVVSRAGSGLYLNDDENARAFRLPEITIEEGQAMAQVMELLLAVEVGATRVAAQHRDEADLRAMQRALLDLEDALARGEIGDEEDYAFHRAIVQATHNPYFIGLCGHLEGGTRHFIRRSRMNTRVNFKAEMQDVQHEHQAILEAIRRQDMDGAGEAAARHLQNAARRTLAQARR